MNRKSNLKMLPVIIALAWPTMLEQLMQTAVQYIDTAMVGSLGTSATAAVGATTTVNWLIGSTVSALGVGFLSVISQACGARDFKKARLVSTQIILAVLFTGSIFTLLTLSLSGVVPTLMRVDPAIRESASRYFFILYTPMLFRAASIIFGTGLRAVGDTKTPMVSGIFVNITNVVLNFLLIYPTRTLHFLGKEITVYGADLGVEGAAIASAVSFAVGGILITICYLRHPILSPKGERIRLHKEILNPCLKVALPNMMQRFGTSLGYVAFASMINSLGEISTAAHTIANTVESAFYIPGYGMQTAAATLAGNALGARDKKKMKDLARSIIPVEVFLMIISGTLLFIFAERMMGIFSKSDEVITLGATVLKMVAVSEPFYGVSIIIEGMMQGVGKTVRPFVYNIIGMWGIRIVGTYIFISFFGGSLVAAWGCMIAHNLLLFFLFLWDYLSGRWNPLKQ